MNAFFPGQMLVLSFLLLFLCVCLFVCLTKQDYSVYKIMYSFIEWVYPILFAVSKHFTWWLLGRQLTNDVIWEIWSKDQIICCSRTFNTRPHNLLYKVYMTEFCYLLNTNFKVLLNGNQKKKFLKIFDSHFFVR